MLGVIVSEYFSEKRPDYEYYAGKLEARLSDNGCDDWFAEPTYNGIEVMWRNRIMFALYYSDDHQIRVCSTGLIPDDYQLALYLTSGTVDEIRKEQKNQNGCD